MYVRYFGKSVQTKSELNIELVDGISTSSMTIDKLNNYYSFVKLTSPFFSIIFMSFSGSGAKLIFLSFNLM